MSFGKFFSLLYNCDTNLVSIVSGDVGTVLKTCQRQKMVDFRETFVEPPKPVAEYTYIIGSLCWKT